MTKSEAEKNFFIYVPEYQKRLLENSNTCNFGLFFQRMCRWQQSGGGIQKDSGIESFEIWNERKRKNDTKKEKLRKDYAEYPASKSDVLLKSADCHLVKINKARDDYLDFLAESGIKTFSIRAKTISPFITGLGSGHPTETGMILDRNTGVPYIPAPSIKGVLRLACAINLAEKNEAYRKSGIVPDNDEKLVRYFGSMSQNEKETSRGQLIFLDAYPEGIPHLKVDIMNPHFSKYYSGENKQPVETENPVPIKFLTVKEGTQFTFCCAFMPLGNEIISEEKRLEIENDVDEMFKTAFEKVGFGGKTAIGYGRFAFSEKKSV